MMKLNNVFPLISEEYRITLYKYFEANGLSTEFMPKSLKRDDDRIPYVALRESNRNSLILRQGSMINPDAYSNSPSNKNDNIVYLFFNIINEDIIL